MRTSLILSLLFFSLNSYSAMRALNTAATGMAAQDQNVSTISNNIANVNTVGFKKNRAEFEDLHYQTIKAAGSRSSATTQFNVGVQIGSGAKVSGIRKEFTTGNEMITNNPYDLMVKGEGFFGLIMPNNEIRYTKDGSFSVNNQGIMVNRTGYTVFPGITLPQGTVSVAISPNGNVEAYLKNQIEPVQVGTIPVFTFTNAVGLSSVGGNNYKVTKSSGPPIQQVAGQNNAGSILQGTLESSNVSIMNEMTNLIKAQRAYEMNSKVMGVADQMLQTVNNIR